MLTLQLPEDIERQLETLAAAKGRTASAYAEAALVEYMSDLNDVEEAEARLKDIREGRSSTISLEDFMKKHGLED